MKKDPELFGLRIRICSPSIARIQLGKFHLQLNSAALNFKSIVLGLGIKFRTNFVFKKAKNCLLNNYA